METVGELIEALQRFDPSLPICYYENGEISRTGDYHLGLSPQLITIRPLNFGGCADDDVDSESDFWAGEKFDAVYIGNG